MTDKEKRREGARKADRRYRPTESEILEMIASANRQYAEYVRIAELADLSDPEAIIEPEYAWDNPIGFVVSAQPDG